MENLLLIENFFASFKPSVETGLFIPLAFLSAFGFLLVLIFIRWKNGKAIFLPSVSALTTLILFSFFLPPFVSFIKTKQLEPVIPPWPYEPPTRYEAGIHIDVYNLENQFKWGGLDICAFLEGNTGYLYVGQGMLFLEGNRWNWDFSRSFFYGYGPASYRIVEREIRFNPISGTIVVPIVGSDKVHSVVVPEARICSSTTNPEISIEANLPSSVVMLLTDADFPLSVNGYSYAITLLNTRNLLFEVRCEALEGEIWGYIGKERVDFEHVEEHYWRLEYSFPEGIPIEENFVFYANRWGMEVHSGGILTSIWNFSISRNGLRLGPFGFISYSSNLIRSREVQAPGGSYLNLEYEAIVDYGYSKELWRVYVNAYSPVPLSPPLPPPPPPLRFNELLLNYRTVLKSLPEGILLSLNATFENGNLLPPTTLVRIISPISAEMVKAENEWTYLFPHEFNGREVLIEVKVPGYFPRIIRTVLSEERVADLKVILYDAVTKELAEGYFTIIANDGAVEKRSSYNPALFEGLRSKATISVYQALPVGAVSQKAYYPTQTTVHLEPWSLNQVNIYLQPIITEKTGTSSLSVTIENCQTNTLTVFFGGVRYNVSWNPTGYWQFGVARQVFRGMLNERGNWQVQVEGKTIEFSPKSLQLTISGLPSGTFPITVAVPGYESQSKTITLYKEKIYEEKLILTKLPEPKENRFGNLEVKILEKKTKLPIVGATVVLSNGTEIPTNSNGIATLFGLPEGDYTVSAIMEGYFDVTKKVSIGSWAYVQIELGSYLEVSLRARYPLELVMFLLLTITIILGALISWRLRA